MKNKRRYNGSDRNKFRRFGELPEELQESLAWFYGEEAAMQMLVPQAVLDARQSSEQNKAVKCIVPKLFIRADGLFVIRDKSGERAVEGSVSSSGLRYYLVHNFQNWAHIKVYEHFVGVIPRGYKVIFIDGDPGNAALTNLALIPREIEEDNAWSTAA